MIRGAAIPVIETGRLVGTPCERPARFVVIRAAGRRAALAVDDVEGIRDVPAGALEALPPLLELADRGAVTSIGALDGGLLAVLDAMRVVPEALWPRLAAAAEPARGA